ncbi:type 4 prepilin-like proteins leader peptide-processing enzyme [Psychromonas marina]|uniref:Prepilin leader peptidase/N-methyltransferase n=1 Tax=Psychromonas marina TaxID=88364 RepID=A0ABQ6DWZ4_9GAMM|nr:A24 family peptidase [Psychromonas marina]GLS89673.1 type 4 prepilin-like proteins leader peptide-processing enzyme [Psychromonas marina]
MNDFIMLMEQVPELLYATVIILGVLVGSFLNVVIYRLPVMMERSWKAECAECFPEANIKTEDERFNLVVPRSRCPQCNHLIGSNENIPLISWLVQKGCCKHCGCKISKRYPSIELLTGFMSLAVAMVVPFGWPLLFALIFTWVLISLTFIDFDTMLLPDQLTLPLLWLGLIINISGTFVGLTDAVLGAAFGYLSLWSIYWGFKLITGKEGMGYGDFKLLAALGAWFGWQALPLIILLSSFAGAIIGIAVIAASKDKQSRPMPFGPYLAIAGWLYLVYGTELNALYYSLVL